MSNEISALLDRSTRYPDSGGVMRPTAHMVDHLHEKVGMVTVMADAWNPET
jgi:hypothetical protein